MATKSQIEDTSTDPKEIAKLEKSLLGKDQAPTVAEQSGTFVDWQRVRDQLGTPFDAEKLPLRKLRQMRRDPMIAFALHYIKTPLVRVQWHMEAKDKDGPNPQVAGFMDSAWRAIHARYILQHTLDLDFGFQSLVKRFVQRNPGGIYVDPQTGESKPVWDEGSILPVVWKPFVALPPERVRPLFNDANGEFDGILYEIAPADRRKKTSFASTSASGNQNQREIDVYHSLWATENRDSVFGSLYGFPRISHAYRYWWSFWFRWAMADRAFERLAIPPLLAYHPDGFFTDPDNPSEKLPYFQIAIDAAQALRSNAIAAVPSTLAASGLEEKGTTQREWEFKFLEPSTDVLQNINEGFNQLDILKMRAVWIPEQAFVEGGQGTSSRNVAGTMFEIFTESQKNKWEEIAFHINEYNIPQLLVKNFPEFVANGGTCRIVGHGFAKSDLELLKQLIQLVGQEDPMRLNVDVPEALRRLDIPLRTPEQLLAEQNRVAAEAAAGNPPGVTPTPGSVGVVPNQGFTNGGSVPEPNAFGSSVTGFSDMVYIAGNEVIELSDDADYISDLPDSHHLNDKVIKALSAQLRKLWLAHYRSLYPDFAKFMNSQSIELSDEELDGEELMLADGRMSLTAARKLAKKIVNQWQANNERVNDVRERSAKIIRKIMERAGKVIGKKHSLSLEEIREQAQADYDDYLERNVGKMIKSVHGTVKDELNTYLVNALQEGKNSKEISRGIQEHFADFPAWKANRVARSETRNATAASVLINTDAIGLTYVRASDGEEFDEDCKERNGKLYTIKEAWKELNSEITHPNCALGFTPVVRTDFSIENCRELPDNAPEDSLAWFDKETCTAYVPMSLSDEDADVFLRAVAEVL
jgi:hypothetical protein